MVLHEEVTAKLISKIFEHMASTMIEGRKKWANGDETESICSVRRSVDDDEDSYEW